MKSSIATGIVLLSVFLALSFCVAFAAKETASKDKANVTTLANMTNTTINATKALNTTNVTMPQNATVPMNVTITKNVTAPQNATSAQNATKNGTTPFAKAKGKLM